MLHITEADVRRLLPMRECIGLMESAFRRLAANDAINQPRRRLYLPTRSTLHYMAGADGRYFGAKIYSTNPRHGAHFLFLLYRAVDGEPLALIEANHLGQIRTGAASGLATRLLARPESKVVAVIGSGFQARTQVEAMAAVLHIERVRVWSRSAERRSAFARECAGTFQIGVEAAPSAEAAVRGADVVVTATNSAEPVVESAWIAPGTHINAVGSNQAKRRELPPDLVASADLIAVDSREQSQMEAGDLLLADIDWARTVELQEVASGRVARRSPTDITLFKSNGMAVEDVAAAAYVFEQFK